MNSSDEPDWFALERLYDEGQELFLSGKHDDALDRFKRIYEDTLDLRDVTEIVDDYYALPKEQWVAKYIARFKARPSPNPPVQRMAAGGRLSQIRKRLAAAIAHFFR